MKKPNFLIIGGKECGLTSLYKELECHNEVFLIDKTDSPHFSNKNCSNSNMIVAYDEQFDHISNSYKAIGEKAISYLWSYSEKREFCKPNEEQNLNIAEDAFKQLGEKTKIISSLRHPVIRAIFAFFDHFKRGRVKSGSSISEYYTYFDLIDMGFYAEHLKPWYSLFGDSQNLTLIMERDIIPNPNKGVNRICDFLSLTHYENTAQYHREHNFKLIFKDGAITIEAKDSPIVTGHDIKFLIDLYQEDMDQLRTMLSDDLVEWKTIDQELLTFSMNYERKSSLELLSSLNKEDSIFGLNNPHQVSMELGIDISPNSVKLSSDTLQLERPIRLSSANLMHNCSVGAFTYLTDGAVYNTDIGRYCSIAKSVNIGQGNHPLNWLSTNPFQYEDGLRFRHGKLFPYASQYSGYELPIDNRKKALNSIRKPKTKIGNDVWIGHGVIILPGVSIGNGAIIGAGSVVTKDVEAYSIVGGCPAKLLKYRFEEKIIKRLNELCWWDYAPWSLSNVDFNDIEKAIAALKAKKESFEILPYSIEQITLKDIKGFFQ